MPAGRAGWERSHLPAVDIVVLAMGFVGPETAAVATQLAVELDARGNVRVDSHFATYIAGVFAVGDAAAARASSSGPSPTAAKPHGPWTLSCWDSRRSPTRGVHQPFLR